MRKLTTDNVAALKPYEPGKPVEEVMRELGLTRCVKLASNENPLGPSPMALEAMARALSEVSRYPDSSAYYLKQRLAKHYDVAAEQLVLGNGSVELIELIARTFLGPDEEAIVSQYAFVMYWLAIQAVNGHGVVVPARGFGHDLPAMAAAVNERTKLIYIANPNNPTGTMASRRDLDALFHAIPEDVIVVLDEAYAEFIKEPDYPNGLDDVARGRSVIVLRTFSKAYGLAGLRVGYGVGKAELIRAMEKVRTPFNTTAVSQRAALAALDDREHVERTYRMNLRERAYLEERLTAMGVRYIPSAANFLLLDVGRPCDGVFQALLARGVIVRPMGGYGLATHLRLSVGTRPENEEFLTAFEDARRAGAA